MEGLVGKNVGFGVGENVVGSADGIIVEGLKVGADVVGVMELGVLVGVVVGGKVGE